mgnify:CR=1 FL=1
MWCGIFNINDNNKKRLSKLINTCFYFAIIYKIRRKKSLILLIFVEKYRYIEGFMVQL